jgi:hypothetical protein
VSAPDAHAEAPQKVRLQRVWLVAWALITFAVTGSLASAHWYGLPRPQSPAVLSRALAARRRPDERGLWLATHVLYLECRCSRRILDHLLERRRLPEVGESVLMVGSDPALSVQLTHAGYRVESLTPHTLATRYQILAAPVLIVSDPADGIRYLGGYTQQKQGPDLRDQAIIASLRAGGREPELPLLGCAVSRSLQKILDPFGLKYSGSSEQGFNAP